MPRPSRHRVRRDLLRTVWGQSLLSNYNLFVAKCFADDVATKDAVLSSRKANRDAAKGEFLFNMKQPVFFSSMGVIAISLLLLCVAPAWADGITFIGTSGSLSAQASFSIGGNALTVVLSNASGSPVTSVGEVLTGLYFDIAGNPTGLSLGSSDLTSGSTFDYVNVYSPHLTTDSHPIGSGWAFVSGQTGASPASYAIAASNYQGNLKGTSKMLGGVDYGIISGVGSNPSSTFADGSPYIIDSATFTLVGLPNAFNLASVTDVSFQYGEDLCNASGSPCGSKGSWGGWGSWGSWGDKTSPTCWNIPGTPTPEPPSVLLFGFGLFALLFVGQAVRRRAPSLSAAS